VHVVVHYTTVDCYRGQQRDILPHGFHHVLSAKNYSRNCRKASVEGNMTTEGVIFEHWNMVQIKGLVSFFVLFFSGRSCTITRLFISSLSKT